MRERFIRFMYGRHGVDRLSKHLVTAGLLLSILSIFIRGNLLYILALALFIYGYFRIFSRNNAKRYQEACAYERFWSRIKNYPSRLKNEMAQRKEYRIFKCPKCRQKIRVPKGRGNIEIRCQKCLTVFRKHS